MTTTNLGMTLPTVGADTDNWGSELNANFGLIDIFAGKLIPGGTAPVLEVKMSSAATPITTGAANQIAFDTLVTDSKGWWNSGTKRYTPMFAGRYRIRVSCFISGNGLTAQGSSLIELYLRFNGSSVARHITRTQNGFNASCGGTGAVEKTITLNGSTDYIDAAIYTDMPNTNIIGGSVAQDSFMQIEYLGP